MFKTFKKMAPLCAFTTRKIASYNNYFLIVTHLPGLAGPGRAGHGIPWNSMDFHGIPRDSLEFHGIPWNSMAGPARPGLARQVGDD